MKNLDDFTQKYLESNIESYLQKSKDLLINKSFKKAHYYLSQCLMMSHSLKSNDTKNHFLVSSLTTLGHYHKYLGNFPESLRHYQEALRILTAFGITNRLISLHLHISSVYSSQGQHEEALRYGLKSLGLLKRTQFCTQEYIESTVVAFYNIGVEYEFLKEFKDAEACYMKGYKFAQAHLGNSHNLTTQIRRSIQELVNSNVTKLDFRKISSTETTEVSRRRSSSFNFRWRSTSFSSKIKRIDVEIYRKIEVRAAIMIQKVWRGYWARKNMISFILDSRLTSAAKQAKNAIQKYENEKKRIESVKKNLEKISRQGVRGVRNLASIRKFKEIFE